MTVEFTNGTRFETNSVRSALNQIQAIYPDAVVGKWVRSQIWQEAAIHQDVFAQWDNAEPIAWITKETF